ncbi:hypothetical protein EI555_008100, partial [Monodon monoceros]
AETAIHLLGRVAGLWQGSQSMAARASSQSFLEGAWKFAVSHMTSLRVAKFPENRNRHIYRDVSPYDYSLDREEEQRSYILTECPLPNSGCHFWLMVWQQKTKSVVTLNRIYWPTKGEGEMLLKETGFSVKFLSEDVKSYYTVHLLQLGTTNSDFGVPESPVSFLSLNPEYGTVVIRRSAGIGRSGTFSLVDICLVLMEKGDNINIKQLEIQVYRNGGKNFLTKTLCPVFDQSPSKITSEKYNGNRIGLEEEKLTGDRYTGLSSEMQDTLEENSESALRKRLLGDRKEHSSEGVANEAEVERDPTKKGKDGFIGNPFSLRWGLCQSFWLVLLLAGHCFLSKTPYK